MKQTIGQYQFTEAFRAIRPDNFTYSGLESLFEYFEYFEQDAGQEVELDVIAICCEFSEYESLEEVREEYSLDADEELQDYTSVIYCSNDHIIIQNF